jgi:3-oxoacyl-[acyl-carrier-protein] synthase-3
LRFGIKKAMKMPLLIQKQSIILFCTQFGDVKHGTSQSDTLPSLATRVKKITNKKVCCLRYPFVLAGLKGYFKQMLSNQNGATLLVIGSETLELSINMIEIL